MPRTMPSSHLYCFFSDTSCSDGKKALRNVWKLLRAPKMGLFRKATLQHLKTVQARRRVQRLVMTLSHPLKIGRPAAFEVLL